MSDPRAETVYFVVVDRFFEADPEQHHGRDRDCDPTRTDGGLYWGGDLRGVVEKLDYLQSLGVGALWLTPPFAQQEGTASPTGARISAYHGYWPKDLMRLDAHLVDTATDEQPFSHKGVLDDLLDGLRARGMRLVLDVVVAPAKPAEGGRQATLEEDGALVATYDAGAGAWREGDRTWDDLSPRYRRWVTTGLHAWLDRGVDAIRFASLTHAPPWLWQEIAGDLRARRPDVFLFGEWSRGGCWKPDSVAFVNASEIGIQDFAWRNAVVAALAHKSAKGFEELGTVVAEDGLFRDANLLVTFVDSHDLPRFLSLSDDPDRFRLATLLTMLSRGTPCLFYGNEQGLHDDRNRGHDPYNRPMMTSFEPTAFGRDLATVAAVRRTSPAVQKGGMRKKHLSPEQWAFTRVWGGSVCLVVANRSDTAMELGLTGVELPDGRFVPVADGEPIDVQDGATRVSVPARGIVAYSHVVATPADRVNVDVLVHGIKTAFGEEILVYGDAPELGSWDPARAVLMSWVNNASWGVTIPFDVSSGREVAYKFLIRRSAGVLEREPGAVHRQTVPLEPTVSVWRDSWR